MHSLEVGNGEALNIAARPRQWKTWRHRPDKESVQKASFKNWRNWVVWLPMTPNSEQLALANVCDVTSRVSPGHVI